MKRPTAKLTKRVNGADLRVIEPGSGAGLAREPLEPLVVARVFGRQELERYVPAQLRLAGLVDNAHAAAADFGQNLVAGHIGPGR